MNEVGKKTLVLGNEAIAHAVVEAGCQVASAYPGTPSSEILPAIAKYADEMGSTMVVEWGANEKVAYEIAVAATFAGARACVAMKQVGLNVAADPYMTTALYNLKGGMLLIVADDPGCHSSQTEQDSRFMAQFARIPVFDPSDAVEAHKMVFDAYSLSEKYGVAVMLRPTTRVDHCRQTVELGDEIAPGGTVKFERDMTRWLPLPANVRVNYPAHNKRIEKIREDFETGFENYTYEVPAKGTEKLAIIVSGVVFAVVSDLLKSMGRDDVSLLKVGTPYPLPYKKVGSFIEKHENVLILEETYPVIEDQLIDRSKIKGRWNGFVPREGELLPEVVEEILLKVLGETGTRESADDVLKTALDELGLKPRKPQLCAGCPHRASYFAIRKAYPNGILPSDIGCYSLSVNQKAADTCIDMGAAVSGASGLFLAHKVSGQERPLIATIGDSTFYHNGVAGLETAVYNRHAFVLCILDNSITAMTGGQDHPGTGGKLRRGEIGTAINTEAICRGCGVNFVETIAPYDIAACTAAVKRAYEFAKEKQEPAVLIFKHPCMLLREEQPVIPMTVNDKCIGCNYCMEHFSCPGLVMNKARKRAEIDMRYCVSCGVCVHVCPQKAIVQKEAN